MSCCIDLIYKKHSCCKCDKTFCCNLKKYKKTNLEDCMCIRDDVYKNRVVNEIYFCSFNCRNEMFFDPIRRFVR